MNKQDKKHMITVPYLMEGRYKTTGKLNWHERLRIKMAFWLFESVPKRYDLEIKTTTGITQMNKQRKIGANSEDKT